MNKRTSFFLIVALLIGTYFAAVAGGPLGANGTTPYRFPSTAIPITYRLDSGALGSFNATTARAIANYAFQQWGSVSSAAISFTNGGFLARNVTSANDAYISGTNQFSDGVNPVIFDSSGAITDSKLGIGAKSSVLGFATSAVNNTSGALTEGYAIINGFLSGSGTAYDQDYYKAVITHEIGHFIGLAHTQITMHGDYPTMYPTAQDTTMKSLAPDDTLALVRLYPSSGWAARVGTITGTVKRPNNANLSGVNVVAMDSATGICYSTVVDYFSGNDTYYTNRPTASGSYSLSGLPPGTYFVRIEPVNAGFSGGSSVASYSTPVNTSTAREWYNGAGEGGDMLVDNTNDKVGVRVTANTTTSGINFTSNESTSLSSVVTDNGVVSNIFLLPGTQITKMAVRFNAPWNGSLLGVKFRVVTGYSNLPLNGTITVGVHANASGSLAGVPGTLLGSVTIPFSDLATDQVNEIWLRGLGTAVNFNTGDTFHISLQTNGVGTVALYGDNGVPSTNRSSYYTSAGGWKNYPQGYPNGTPGYNLMLTAVYSSSNSGNPQPAVTLNPTSLDFGRVRPGANVDKTIVVSNSGSATLNVTGTGIFGRDSANFSIVSNGGSFSLASGATRTLTVRFAPTNAGGSKSASLSLTSNAATSPNTAPLQGQAVAPLGSKLSNGINFNQRRTGGIYTVQFAVLRNVGNDTLRISGTSLSGPDAGTALTLLSTPGAIILPPDSTDTVMVRFSPAQRRSYSATLTISHDDTSGATSFPVTGTGIAPVYATTSDTISFGNVRVGATGSSPSFYIRNTGDAPMNVTRVAVIGGPDTASVQLVAPVSAPFIITPGDSVAVQLGFSPEQRRVYEVKLRVTHDGAGSPTDRVVTGRGVAPSMSMPGSIAIGSVRVGSSSEGSLKVENLGDAPLSITRIEIVGPNASEFTLLSPTSLPAQVPVGAGGSLDVAIRFQPTAPGLRIATLRISSDDPALPTREIPLAEIGLQGALGIGPLQVDFGDVLVSGSGSGSVTLSNTGTDTLTITATQVSGTEFAIDGSNLVGTTIPPSGTAQLKLTFNPTVAGSRVGSLKVTTDVSATPSTVQLVGRGVAAGLSVNRSSIAFGSVKIGAARLDSFQVRNIGTLPLAGVTVQVSGGSSAAFSLDAPATPFTLTPNESRTIHVTLAPQSSAGPLAAMVEVREGTGMVRQVDLSASVIAGAIGAPLTIDYGTRPAVQLPRDTTFTIRNLGAEGFAITAAATTGRRSDGEAGSFFQLKTPTPVTIAPGDSASITLHFDPFVLNDGSAARDFTGTLKLVTTSLVDPSWTIQLLGSIQAPTSAVPGDRLTIGGASLAIDATMPNPASSILEVLLSSEGIGRIPVTLYIADLNGRRVADGYSGAIDAAGASTGRRVAIDVSALPSGSYRVVLITSAGTTSRPIVVVR